MTRPRCRRRERAPASALGGLVFGSLQISGPPDGMEGFINGLGEWRGWRVFDLTWRDGGELVAAVRLVIAPPLLTARRHA